MYLKISNKKKIDIIILKSFWEKLKGLKFNFDKLNYGIKFPNKKLISTVFLCQRVDIIMTDKNNKILYLYSNVKSEKYFLPKFKVKDIYLFPLETAKEFKVGDILPIEKKKGSK